VRDSFATPVSNVINVKDFMLNSSSKPPAFWSLSPRSAFQDWTHPSIYFAEIDFQSQAGEWRTAEKRRHKNVETFSWTAQWFLCI